MKKEHETDVNWIVIEPGVIALQATQLTIHYRPASSPPYEVKWNNEKVYDGCEYSLHDAKHKARELISQLLETGLEP